MLEFGINSLPVCPKCGGLPGMYSYYVMKDGKKNIRGLLCSNCRVGPDSRSSEDPISTWINWATPKNAAKH